MAEKSEKTSYFKIALQCKCPSCLKGDLYQEGFTLEVRETCSECGFEISKNDSADGPAVILVFILGFILCPLALWVDSLYRPPVWVHAVVWGSLALVMIVGSLRYVKSFVIWLQYKNRGDHWGE